MTTLQSYEAAVAFHGHSCPGLALGYRAAVAAMTRLDRDRAPDEEIVAIVENDSCAVDAIQVVTGCTFGKGNLIFRDIGKRVYTFCARESGASVRVVENYLPFSSPGFIELRSAASSSTASEAQKREFQALLRHSIDDILEAPEETVLAVRDARVPVPPRARLFKSLSCSRCGESVAEPRAVNTPLGPCCADCAGKA
jgi:formylmethanofuran dehydrogenase subunit E